MSISISLPPVLQILAGDVKNVDVNGSTVGECFKELAARYPQLKSWLFTRQGNLPKGMNIFINGENVYPELLAHPVHDGDVVHIFSPVLGG